ncbi:hypothetical protein H0O03_01110 [Candidatus Micrarchaeota archaeon]|nr:hypothetical protein [Candidatus Micrarchaeota archaeon]
MKFYAALPLLALLALAAPALAVLISTGEVVSVDNGTVAGQSGTIESAQPSVRSALVAEATAISSAIVVPVSTTEATLTVEKMRALEVKPTQIFSPVLAQATNIQVNTAVEDGKVVYRLALPYNISVYKAAVPTAVSSTALFNLAVDQPVEFKVNSQEIVVNNEQVINYHEIAAASSSSSSPTAVSASVPLVSMQVQSTVTTELQSVTVVPQPTATSVQVVSAGKEGLMPIQSDFKVENKRLYLVENASSRQVNVMPAQVYSSVEAGGASVKTAELRVENQKAVYALTVEEPFNLFWVIPMKVESTLKVDAGENKVLEVNRPWFSFLGGTTAPFVTGASAVSAVAPAA